MGLGALCKRFWEPPENSGASHWTSDNSFEKFPYNCSSTIAARISGVLYGDLSPMVTGRIESRSPALNTFKSPEDVVNNVQVGMVQTFFPEIYPVLGRPPSTRSSPNPATIRLWAKYFSSVDPGLPTVTIPRKWMDFFTMMLLKQSSSTWAEQFLQSPAWAFFKDSCTDNSFLFSLPKSKPSVSLSELCCSEDAERTSPSSTWTDHLETMEQSAAKLTESAPYGKSFRALGSRQCQDCRAHNSLWLSFKVYPH